MKKIRVAIVDDSAFVRKALIRVLSNQESLEFVGVAESGEELLDHIDEWQPDVITLDLTMPGMGGLQTLDRIMVERPTPVIILSTHAGEDAPLTIEALHRGAVDFIDKQRYSLMDFASLRSVLLEKIFEVTSAPPTEEAEPALEPSPPAPLARRAPKPKRRRLGRDIEILLIGASTGGPPTIERILTDLGTGLEIPVVVAQHMPPRFTLAFAERLNTHLPMRVREATDGETLVASTAYIAPGGLHLSVGRSDDGKLFSRLSNRSTGEYHQPSVDVLFSSAARCVGRRAVAVLLTGMGRDGAAGMEELNKAGAWTIAQDQESCIVYGMPQAAVSLGAVDESLPDHEIGSRLRELLGLAPAEEAEE